MGPNPGQNFPASSIIPRTDPNASPLRVHGQRAVRVIPVPTASDRRAELTGWPAMIWCCPGLSRPQTSAPAIAGISCGQRGPTKAPTRSPLECGVTLIPTTSNDITGSGLLKSESRVRRSCAVPHSARAPDCRWEDNHNQIDRSEYVPRNASPRFRGLVPGSVASRTRSLGRHRLSVDVDQNMVARGTAIAYSSDQQLGIQRLHS